MSGELINIVTSEVVSQVVELIKDDIYKIYLYGSYARGDYTSESDIDIMIVFYQNVAREGVTIYG